MVGLELWLDGWAFVNGKSGRCVVVSGIGR